MCIYPIINWCCGISKRPIFIVWSRFLKYPGPMWDKWLPCIIYIAWEMGKTQLWKSWYERKIGLECLCNRPRKQDTRREGARESRIWKKATIHITQCHSQKANRSEKWAGLQLERSRGTVLLADIWSCKWFPAWKFPGVEKRRGSSSSVWKIAETKNMRR